MRKCGAQGRILKDTDLIVFLLFFPIDAEKVGGVRNVEKTSYDSCINSFPYLDAKGVENLHIISRVTRLFLRITRGIENSALLLVDIDCVLSCRGFALRLINCSSRFISRHGSFSSLYTRIQRTINIIPVSLTYITGGVVVSSSLVFHHTCRPHFVAIIFITPP